MDGLRDEHDLAVCRDGVYDVAVRAIKAALARGFRVTTNTTLFNDADAAIGLVEVHRRVPPARL